jgi:hypothetical protein
MVSPPFNPYAPPKAADVAPPELVFGDFDISRAINDSWEICKRHFPLWLGAGFVAAVLAFFSFITIVGNLVLIPVLLWGTTRFLLRMVDGAPSFDDLFAGFKNYLSVLGRTLLYFVIAGVLGVLSESLVFVGQFVQSTPLVVLGWIVYFAFFCTVHMRFWFALFLIVDRDMGAIAAFGTSWNMTRGKTLKLMGLAILGALIAMAGVFACGIGVVWTMTMSWAMYGSAYRQMVGPPQNSPPAPAW